MAKDLEEALVNIENKLGGSPQEHMDLGEHLDYIEELLDEGGGGTGSGITDVQINGSSVVSDKVADIELKTVEGQTITGSGNISIPTYSPFDPAWRSDTIDHLIADINADANAVVGKSYLGEVEHVTAAEGLFNGNAEIVVNIMNGSNNHKVIWCIVSSNNVAPYHWEATYSSGHISAKGWTGYQPKLVSGTDIKTINDTSLLGSGNIDTTLGSNYFVVNGYSDLLNIPGARLHDGSLACCGNSSFYKYTVGVGWNRVILESVPDDVITINANFDITATTTISINIDNLGAWLDGDKVESHIIIAFTDYGVIFSPTGGGSLIDPVKGFDLTTIILYNSKQYLAKLHITPGSSTNNATLSFQEIEGGGSSASGGLPLYKLYLKQTATLTLNRRQEGDQDFTQTVNNVVGFEFQSKDIVSRYNDYIGLVNTQYSTSFSTISSESEIANSLKTIISTLVSASVSSSLISQGISILVRILSLKEGITTQQWVTSDEYKTFDNNYYINVFGTSAGSFDTGDIYVVGDYYCGVIGLGIILPVIAYNGDASFYAEPFTTNSNQGVVIDSAVKLSLVDDYDLNLENIGTVGGSNGSGTIEQYHISIAGKMANTDAPSSSSDFSDCVLNIYIDKQKANERFEEVKTMFQAYNYNSFEDLLDELFDETLTYTAGQTDIVDGIALPMYALSFFTEQFNKVVLEFPFDSTKQNKALLTNFSFKNATHEYSNVVYSIIDIEGKPLYTINNGASTLGGELMTDAAIGFYYADYTQETALFPIVKSWETLQVTGGSCSSGGGQADIKYNIEVFNSNSNDVKAQISIYKKYFDKYLVELNQVGAALGQATGNPWTDINTIAELKTLFDGLKGDAQLSFSCDLAMNLLVKYAYKSGENPVIGTDDGCIGIFDLGNYDLSTNPIKLGSVTSLDIDIPSAVGKLYWFQDIPSSGATISINANATFTYTEEN